MSFGIQKDFYFPLQGSVFYSVVRKTKSADSIRGKVLENVNDWTRKYQHVHRLTNFLKRLDNKYFRLCNSRTTIKEIV